MELREYLAILRKYWVSIVAVTLAGLVLGTVAAAVQVAPVTAQSAIFISVRDGATARELLGGASFATTQVRSYMLLAPTPLVLQPVIDRLGLDVTPTALAKDDLTVNTPVGSSIIEISVEQKDPALATNIAQAIADELVLAVEKLSPKNPDGERTVIATIITPARIVSPETGGFSLAGVRVGLLLGLILGLAQALVRLLFDRSVSTAKQVVRATGRPVLAEIPFAAEPMGASQLDPYRRLRTNLDAVLSGQPDPSRSLVVTSAGAGEGKSTTAINLASVYAAAGESVLLIDANLRRPQVAQHFGLGQQTGLASVLRGQSSLGEAVQSIGDGNLRVLAAGATVENPADLLASAGMARLLDEAARDYDQVVVDLSSLDEASEVAAIASATGGALLVIGGSATLDSVREASTTLERAGATTLGVLLNRNMPRSR